MCADLQICTRKLTSLQIPDLGRGEITRIFAACYLAILPIQDHERVGECYRKEETEKVEHKNHAERFESAKVREGPMKNLQRTNSFQTLKRCSSQSWPGIFITRVQKSN